MLGQIAGANVRNSKLNNSVNQSEPLRPLQCLRNSSTCPQSVVLETLQRCEKGIMVRPFLFKIPSHITRLSDCLSDLVLREAFNIRGQRPLWGGWISAVFARRKVRHHRDA